MAEQQPLATLLTRVSPHGSCPVAMQAPDYYEIVKEPICLNDISKKMQRREYPTMETCEADFDLLFSNCLEYNGVWLRGGVALGDGVVLWRGIA